MLIIFLETSDSSQPETYIFHRVSLLEKTFNLTYDLRICTYILHQFNFDIAWFYLMNLVTLGPVDCSANLTMLRGRATATPLAVKTSL